MVSSKNVMNTFLCLFLNCFSYHLRSNTVHTIKLNFKEENFQISVKTGVARLFYKQFC